MSTTKPSAYTAWMRKNFPNLTATQQSMLCERLLATGLSPVSLRDKVTTEQLLVAILVTLNSIAVSLPQGMHLIADDILEASIAKMSHRAHGQG